MRVNAKTIWHKHFFSPLCTDEVHGRFDALENKTGIFVLDVGIDRLVRCQTRKDACAIAKRGAKNWVREKTAFMCEIAWSMELAETDVTLFPTLKSLEHEHGTHCGVVEVRVRAHKQIKEQEKHERGYTPAQVTKKLLHDSERQLRQLQLFIARLKKEQRS